MCPQRRQRSHLRSPGRLAIPTPSPPHFLQLGGLMISLSSFGASFAVWPLGLGRLLMVPSQNESPPWGVRTPDDLDEAGSLALYAPDLALPKRSTFTA